MKYILKNAILFPLTLACLASCNQFKRITGESPMGFQVRPVSGFSKIEFYGDGELAIVKGESYKVELTDYENLFPYLETTVGEPNKLKIKYKAGLPIRNTKLKVTVYMPLVTEVTLRGNGSVNMNMPNATPGKLDLNVIGDGTILSEPVKSGSLSVNISGNGRIKMSKVETAMAYCKIVGDGNIQIQDGNVDELNSLIKGNAKIDICKVPVKRALMTITGDAVIWSNVLDSVRASIVGDGYIYVLGKPTIHEVKMVGNGKIKTIENCIHKQ